MRKLLIVFGYKRLRGKTTSALITHRLLEEMGIKSRIDSFAYSLKEGIGKGVFGMNIDQLYGNKKEILDPYWNFTPRWMMQYCGTDLFRNHLGKDIWSKTVERRFLNDKENSVIIDDLRFFSEIKIIKKYNGYLIKCNRNIVEDIYKDTHHSETELDGFMDWDYQLDNTKDKKFLDDQIKEIISSIMEKEKNKK